MAASSAWSGSGRSVRPASIQPWAARATASSGGRFPAPLPCPAAVAPRDRRRRRVRRPPGGEARRIELARAQWRQCGGGRGGRGERAGGGPAGQPAEQADEAERVGDGAVAVGHRVERRIGPVQRVGGTGEGLRQAARTGPTAASAVLAVRPAARSERSSGWTQAWAWASQPAASAVAMRARRPSRTASGAAAARASSRASASVASHSGTSRPASAVAGQPGVRAGDGAWPIAGLGRQAPRRSASVSSGVSCQDGRSRSASSSGSPNGRSPGIGAFPQAIGFVGPA